MTQHHNTAGRHSFKPNPAKTLASSMLLCMATLLSAQSQASEATTTETKPYAVQVASCPVDPTWITNPSLPTEVKKSGADGSSNFCDFYQFSTQAFLYLMSPAKDGSGRNFQQQSQFHVLEFEGDKPGNSCDDKVTGLTLRASVDKSAPGSSMSTGQAGSHASIYAQDGNVIYYQVRFNKSLCDLTGSAVEQQKQGIKNFPAGTYELKFAWKPLSEAEVKANDFVMQETTLNDKPVTLGLVGMHMAIATQDHPEFVWVTYEHNRNSPDCNASVDQSKTTWTFANPACTAGLPGTAGENAACQFNKPPKNTSSPSGAATNICQVHPYGTASTDKNASENISDIQQQNADMQMAVTSKGDASMQVLNNYFTVGALWVSDIGQSSGGVGVPNERGSLRLANTVAETDFQNVDIDSKKFISNCFGCHNYAGTSTQTSNNITSQALSHIFQDIVIGKGLSVDVSAGQLIADNSKAPAICGGIPDTPQKKGTPGVCKNSASYLKWNGQWTNINSSAGSVCGCEVNTQ
ncbi:Mannan-binding protein [Pseudomonas sp. 8Z]|uniref:mannan-binding protein n=1 Tax=Pseudomonas sp. 8Z TaxID=2653166 RepID=UPI0012F1C4D2|nr:mannan-binding protein [Pseudomonas sp. 8Z]VXC04751.1 Mannan-binding protein [Pseudomonas sp. 8Z]